MYARARRSPRVRQVQLWMFLSLGLSAESGDEQIRGKSDQPQAGR